MQCLFLGQHVLRHWLSNKVKEVINLLDQCSWARYLIPNPSEKHIIKWRYMIVMIVQSMKWHTHTTLLKGSWLCSMDYRLGNIYLITFIWYVMRGRMLRDCVQRWIWATWNLQMVQVYPFSCPVITFQEMFAAWIFVTQYTYSSFYCIVLYLFAFKYIHNKPRP
jgi:hypothetical protein